MFKPCFSTCISRYLPSSELWGVDAKDYGNEIRMINHFKGIAGSPNCKLITATVNEFPHILVVVRAI